MGIGFQFYFAVVLLGSGLTLGCNNHRCPLSNPCPQSAVRPTLSTLNLCVCINHLILHPFDQPVRQFQSLFQIPPVAAFLISQLQTQPGSPPLSCTVPTGWQPLSWLGCTASWVHASAPLYTFRFHPRVFARSSLSGCMSAPC